LPEWRKVGQGSLRLEGKYLLAAIAGGMLAALPVFALDHAFQSYMENTARQRLAQQAKGALELAEARLAQAAHVLHSLARSGVDDCSPQALETMRLAVFTSTPLKKLSILDEQGRTLCTHVGALLDAYAVSREYTSPNGQYSLAAARFRDISERAVRLRLERSNSRSLAALIAVDALLPEFALDGATSGKRMRLTFADGAAIAVRPPTGEATSFVPGEAIAIRHGSHQFPIAVVAEQGRAALAAEYRELQWIARAAMLVFVGFAAILAWVSLRRYRNDPVAQLRRAVRAGEIICYYQPTVDIKNGRIRGAEVLARWRKPDGTLVQPAHFIPLAEQSGLIFELTRALMRRARDEVGASYRERPRLRLAFNLFAGHFADARVVDDIKGIFGGSALSLEQIVLEVTERAPLPDLDDARRVIEMLQALGIRVAIDDVGTGHGGLSYLLKLGADMIKIDKMFVDAIGTERYSQTIIETLVELGHSMKMDVVAEGVETMEQVDYLRLKGVHEAQGYVFAPPLPLNSYLALVEAMERPRTASLPALTKPTIAAA
jgi:sensor c-di-GMP phosphodiesterase-like protein